MDLLAKLWVFKTVADEDRSYKSIEGYNDDLKTQYVYDSKVANHKQVSEGNDVILVDKAAILGFATIEKIEQVQGHKTIKSCPVCSSTNFEERKNKSPKYRCNHKHEFEIPSSKTISVTRFIANYGLNFIKATPGLSVQELRPFYQNNYNRNMSIQLLQNSAVTERFHNFFTILKINRSYYPIASETTYPEKKETYIYHPDFSDDREAIIRFIYARRGQKRFRDQLRHRYGNTCMVTGSGVLDILEAAHIMPYKGDKDNHIDNGLLLRSDIHTLFDLDFIGINPESLSITIHRHLQATEYWKFHEQILLGCAKDIKPSKAALNFRWEKFNSRQALSLK